MSAFPVHSTSFLASSLQQELAYVVNSEADVLLVIWWSMFRQDVKLAVDWELNDYRVPSSLTQTVPVEVCSFPRALCLLLRPSAWRVRWYLTHANGYALQLGYSGHGLCALHSEIFRSWLCVPHLGHQITAMQTTFYVSRFYGYTLRD